MPINNDFLVIFIGFGLSFGLGDKLEGVNPAPISRIVTNIKIVPVYMKSVEHKDFFEFKIAECNFPDPRQELEGIDKLEAINNNIYKVPKINV